MLLLDSYTTLIPSTSSRATNTRCRPSRMRRHAGSQTTRTRSQAHFIPIQNHKDLENHTHQRSLHLDYFFFFLRDWGQTGIVKIVSTFLILFSIFSPSSQSSNSKAFGFHDMGRGSFKQFKIQHRKWKKSVQTERTVLLNASPSLLTLTRCDSLPQNTVWSLKQCPFWTHTHQGRTFAKAPT